LTNLDFRAINRSISLKMSLKCIKLVKIYRIIIIKLNKMLDKNIIDLPSSTFLTQTGGNGITTEMQYERGWSAYWNNISHTFMQKNLCTTYLFHSMIKIPLKCILNTEAILFKGVHDKKKYSTMDLCLSQDLISIELIVFNRIRDCLLRLLLRF
jgi:hypothetical protein